MILSSVGFVLYACSAQRLLATARWSALLVSLAAIAIWGLVAIAAGLLLRLAPT